MKSHRVVAQALADSGVDTVFGLLGDANLLYLPQFVDECGGRFINAVHEGGAVSMADGYARVGVRLGVASVTHGPAVTNGLTALTEAVRARSPLLLLTGDTPAQREHFQALDLRAVANVAGASYHRVLSPSHLVDDIAMITRRVGIERRPLVLDIPADLLHDEVEYLPSRFSGPTVRAPAPDAAALDEALGVIATARRPVVVAGRGAVLSGARRELLALAAAVGAPLATTLLAKDLFRGEAFDLGLFGTLAHHVALDAFNAADCVVAFGASLNHFTTAEGSLVGGKAVVHCDIDPSQPGRHAPVHVAVMGDAAATARAMCDELAAAGHEPSAFRNDELRRRLEKWRPEEEFADTTGDGTVDMRTAMIELDRILPPNRKVVTDASQFASAPWRYLHVDEPTDFAHTANFGSIGLGLATAVGAAAAHPGRLTVAVVGDGGGMMGLIELTTAVRHNLPLAVVVLNNGGYGAEFTKLERHGVDPKHALIEWPPLEQVAAALGGRGHTVRSLDDLRDVSALLPSADGTPLLIDIKADPHVNISTMR